PDCGEHRSRHIGALAEAVLHVPDRTERVTGRELVFGIARVDQRSVSAQAAAGEDDRNRAATAVVLANRTYQVVEVLAHGRGAPVPRTGVRENNQAAGIAPLQFDLTRTVLHRRMAQPMKDL